MKLTRAEARRLHDVEGKTFAQIAQPYGITRQAVHALYHYQPVLVKRKPGPKPRSER